MTAAEVARSEPLVGVVTPVHNGEPYLSACIESVLAQTYQNWLYTIVDNCSTDRSLEIARSYASADQRIRIVENERFLPQISNINRSLSLVSREAKYVKIVFADDWIFPRCLEEMVAVAEAYPEVGIVSSYCLEETRVTGTGLAYPSTVVSGREVGRRSLLDWLFVFGSPNNLLYRADVLWKRQPVFSETSLHEDTEACYEILLEHDLGFVHQVLTFTRRSNESLTNARRVFDPSHWLDRFIITMKFSPSYLGPKESAARIKEVERSYYRFLANRSLYWTGRAFWRYHAQGLLTADQRLDRGRLARAIVQAFLCQLIDLPLLASRLRSIGGRTIARSRGRLAATQRAISSREPQPASSESRKRS